MKARYDADPKKAIARTQAYYAANKEVVKAKARDHYYENIDYYRDTSRRWREANKEYHRELTQLWRAANKERIKQYNTEYYANNRDSEIARCIAYTKAHPEIDAAIKHRRKARKMNAACEHGTRCVSNEFLKMIRESNCLYCGAPGPGQADHFAPLSRGGLHCVENIVPACASCNCSKHAMDPYDWLAGLKRSAA